MIGGVALSNDGTRLAFVGGPLRQIFVRSMDQLAAAPIPNTEGAAVLCFSPDGRSISYIGGDQQAAESQLMTVAVAGGPAHKLANIASRVGPATQHWMPDGNILFVQEGALLKISSNGGQPETLATPDPGNNERFYQSPQGLPGGKEVLVSINVSPVENSNRVVALNLETRQKKVLVERFGVAQFVPSEPGSFYGHLVTYDVRSGSLLAAPFDVTRLEVTAAPVPVVEGIRGIGGSHGAFVISDSGTLAYVPGSSMFSATRQIVWVDRHGVEQLTPAPTRRYNIPRLSPDGARVAIEIQDPSGTDIWVYDLARGTLELITTEGSNLSPVWTPDGKRLIYASGARPGERTRLMAVPVDRSAPPSTITSEANVLLPTSVSPDGETVIGMGDTGANVANEIAVVPLSLSAPAAKPRTFLTSPFRKASAVFSPNGAWVAYASNDTGRSEVYVAAYPGPGGTFPISSDGGTAPRWSRDRRQLFYRNGVKMMAVELQLAPTFRAGRAESLFEGNYTNGYDVAPDGKRFLMIKSARPAPVSQPDQLNIVVNWVEELKARVATK